MNCIFDNISEVAKSKKIPLYVVEKKAGLAAGAISKWKYVNPRINNLLAVAMVLGVSINRLTQNRD